MQTATVGAILFIKFLNFFLQIWMLICLNYQGNIFKCTQLELGMIVQSFWTSIQPYCLWLNRRDPKIHIHRTDLPATQRCGKINRIEFLIFVRGEILPVLVHVRHQPEESLLCRGLRGDTRRSCWQSPGDTMISSCQIHPATRFTAQTLSLPGRGG